MPEARDEQVIAANRRERDEYHIEEALEVGLVLTGTEVKSLPKAVAAGAQSPAGSIANVLDLVGVLAVELFLLERGELLVNELAPGPHNSGHYTIDACLTSQFAQHARAAAALRREPV